LAKIPTRVGDTFSSRRRFNLTAPAEPLETWNPGGEGGFGLGKIGGLLFHIRQMSPQVGEGGGGFPKGPAVVPGHGIGGGNSPPNQK